MWSPLEGEIMVKGNKIKQLASKAFAFSRALGSYFPPKAQTRWTQSLQKANTRILNVSDLYNDKNHWTSQGNLWWKITGPEQKRARSAQEAQSHPALLKPERANLPPAATSNSLLTLLKNEIFKCPHKTNKSASEKPCLEDRNVWSS